MEKFLENIVLSTISFIKEKPKKLFVIFFTPILILSAINLIDFFLLPKIESSDLIKNYERVYKSNNGHRVLIAIQYITEKDLYFTTSKVFIPDKNIRIKYTKIFKTVTFVETDKRDYTEKLSSNLNGIMKYFHLIFFVSLSLGIGIFILKKNTSHNTFLNIIIFNSIMFVVLVYMLFLN